MSHFASITFHDRDNIRIAHFRMISRRPNPPTLPADMTLAFYRQVSEQHATFQLGLGGELSKRPCAIQYCLMPDAKWTKERVNIPECSVVCQKRIISGDIPLSRVPSSCLQSCPVFIFTFCAISRTAVRRRFHQLWLGRRVKIRIDATACLRWKPYDMDRRRTVWGEMVGLRR